MDPTDPDYSVAASVVILFTVLNFTDVFFPDAGLANFKPFPKKQTMGT